MKVIVHIKNSAIPPWNTITDSLREVFPGMVDCEINGLNTEAIVEVDSTPSEISRALQAADFVICWRYPQ